MKLDIQRHKLLKILSDKRIKFDSDELANNEPLGISFDDLLEKMKCNIYKLNVIASELYRNEEIGYFNTSDFKGIFLEKKGLTSFSNNKYKARYWKDILSNLLTISQIIVPIIALVIALITVIDSRQSGVNTEDILLLRKELHMLKEEQDSQTNTISTLLNIHENDSLYKVLKD